MRTSEIDSSLDVCMFCMKAFWSRGTIASSTDARAADPTNPGRKRSSRTGVLDELRGYADSRDHP
jgi:hypothetical protein